jgi:hypothetical protein
MVPNKFLIGSEIVDKILEDDKVQATMRRLNYTNVAKDLNSDEKSLIIGTFMGQELKEMEFSFDENGADIIPGTQIKVLNTNELRRGQAPIQAINPATKLPDIFLGEYWSDIDPGRVVAATAEIFLKSGFFPVIIDPVTLQTFEIDMA